MKHINKSMIKKINITLLICLIVSVVFEFYLLNRDSTSGSSFVNSEKLLSQAEKKNEFLTNEYLELTSLSRLQELALEHGYTNAKIEYYTSPPLAVR